MADLKRVIIHDPVTDTDCSVTAGGDLPITLDGETVTADHGKTLLYKAGTISSATTTAVIAAAVGLKSKVFAIKISGISATLNNVDVKDGTTLVFPEQIQTSGDALGGVALAVTPPAYLFETTANTALNIVTSSAAQVNYYIGYFQE